MIRFDDDETEEFQEIHEILYLLDNSRFMYPKADVPMTNALTNMHFHYSDVDCQQEVR